MGHPSFIGNFIESKSKHMTLGHSTLRRLSLTPHFSAVVGGARQRLAVSTAFRPRANVAWFDLARPAKVEMKECPRQRKSETKTKTRK
jgi:hypothetical protein